MDQEIPVTQPFLPPRREYEAFLAEIWERDWLTNNGPLVRRLEGHIAEFLDSPPLVFTANGTVALQIAIRTLGLTGEIITTPFSYVATTSSIVWENCQPVFADIEPGSLNLDPRAVEEKISEKTTGILATHAFGNPCDIPALESIARRHNLKIIYDAAHCFGTKFQGKSIFRFGDISIASFHATKLYHTVEGGGIFSRVADYREKSAYSRNFGHNGPEKYFGLGINGKNSELHAAMGLVNLKYAGQILMERERLWKTYRESLSPARDSLGFQEFHPDSEPNFSYFPVIFRDETTALRVKSNLEKNNIFVRRYFYPPLADLPYVSGGDVPVCRDISSRILCLPMYHGLEQGQQERVCRQILETV